MENEKIVFTPKFSCGDKLFAVDLSKSEIIEIDVDEICINKLFGISYRNFKGEDAFYQYPESVCFINREYAENFLNQSKTIDNNENE